MANPELHRLPTTALSRISQSLDVPDVLYFAHTCSPLYSYVTQDGPLWKRHCGHVFVCDELLADGARSWYEQWLYLCREFGRYKSCYAQVKSAWNQIESVLQEKCPQVYSDLMASGAMWEADLDELETRLGIQLPDDYRCSLRLHGKLSVPLGSISYLVQSHGRSEQTKVNHKTFQLHGVSDVRIERMCIGWSKVHVGFVAVAENISTLREKSYFRSHSKESAREFLVMVSGDAGSKCTDCPLGHTFTAFSSPIQYGHGQAGGCIVDMDRLYEWFRMPEFSPFADWLSAEADRMQHYYVSPQQKQLTRFILQAGSEAVTGYFTARLATAVLCKALGWHLNQPVALCLIVKLSKDAPVEDSCQLVQDCLLLNGERVDPQRCSFVQTPPKIILHPGHVAEYLSWPLQVRENMILEGFCVMRTAQGGREVRVDLPQITLESVSAKRFAEIQ